MGGCCRNRWADIPEYAPSVTGWIDPRSNGNFRVDLYLRGNVLEVFVDIVYAEDGIAEFHASLWTHGEGLR